MLCFCYLCCIITNLKWQSLKDTCWHILLNTNTRKSNW
jgi:hypothetical protein